MREIERLALGPAARGHVKVRVCGRRNELADPVNGTCALGAGSWASYHGADNKNHTATPCRGIVVPMPEVVARDPKALYLESLRWRHDSLKQQLDAAQKQMDELNRNEASLTLQLRAVEQLLAVEVAEEPNGSRGLEGQASTPPAGAGPELESLSVPTAADHLDGGNSAEDQGTIDWSIWGPKARRIYVAAAQALRDAGVPLHYRVLADEVQKQVPLSGADAGATLIAHMHRAQEVFPRLGRGIYGLRGMTTSDSTGKEPAPIGRPGGRVRRTRRRRTQSVGGRGK